jgi:HNH endonuclease
VSTVPADLLAADCSLSEWTGDSDRCRWDNGLLTGRQTAWCSSRCSDLFWTNHTWSSARAAALARGGWTCALCHRGQALDGVVRWLLPSVGPAERRMFPVEHPDIAAAWWDYTMPRLEVDHILPVWGQRDNGCQHHLENLRVLCHDCHVAETARWRAIRRAMRSAFGIDIATREEILPAVAA